MSKPPILSVVKFPNTSLADVPQMLRELATDIEDDKYGPVGTCAVVVFADRLNVFAFGPDAAAPSAAIVLQAGFQKLAEALIDHGIK